MCDYKIMFKGHNSPTKHIIPNSSSQALTSDVLLNSELLKSFHDSS